ncbi:MAG: cell envelope integrity protein TolA [Methylomonas sp.]
MHKYGSSMTLAMALHIVIILLFSFSFEPDPDLVKAEAAPEIIEATILDSDQIQAEVDRLKQNEAKAEQAEIQHQQQVENARKS